MREFCLQYDGLKAERLDVYLAASLPEFTRSRLQSLIRTGAVLVDGAPASKVGQPITKGMQVILRVPAGAPSGVGAEQIPLDIIFENGDVIIVNKRAGMVVHPSAGHAAGTLVNAALGHDRSMEGVGGEDRPGVVHRLDKDTSGLVVLAKNDAALVWLQRQFESRQVSKTYLALVEGTPPTPLGRIVAPIGRDPNLRKQMAIRPQGKGRDAISEYATLEVFTRHTLLEVHPLTGRTHQIRLHLRFLGCPIAGDRVYGRKKSTIDLDRQFLHAWKLALRLPSEQSMREFVAPLPEELERVLGDLRRGESLRQEGN